MKKLLTNKYEGVYGYQIIITFAFLLSIVFLIIFNFDNIIDNNLYAQSNEILLDRNELNIVTDNINNISSTSWNELYKSNTLRDIYRNNYIKYVSNVTSNLELGNVVYDFNGSIGEKYYNLTLNENKWFLFNSFNNNSNISFYIIDNNMNFYLVNLDITNNINVLNNNDNIQTYEFNNYTFYYNSSNGNIYGYRYVLNDKDINYYLTININNIKLSDNNMNVFLTNLTKNISISVVDSIDYIGFKLPNNLEHVSITDNFMFDFKTDVTVNNWYNNLDDSSIVVDLINKNSKKKYNIKETVSDNIESVVVNTKTNGYRLYNYFGNNIYLKYNAKKHKKFNTSEGGINGIVIYLDNRVYDITFNEEEYKNQKELNSILDDMKSFIITNS